MGEKIKDIKLFSFKKVINNIDNDRAEAKRLLEDVGEYIETNAGLEISNGEESSKHKSVGSVASKYVEALQRSNEQLIKVISLMQKEKALGLEDDEDFDLNDQDFKNQIYSMIKEGAGE